MINPETLALSLGISQLAAPLIRAAGNLVVKYHAPLISPLYDNKRLRTFEEQDMPDYYDYTRPRSFTNIVLKSRNEVQEKDEALDGASQDNMQFFLMSVFGNVVGDFGNRIARPLNIIRSSDLPLLQRWTTAGALAVTDNLDYFVPVLLIARDLLIK